MAAWNLNPHLHILGLDGVLSEVGEGENMRIKFRNVPLLSVLDTKSILKAKATKILKHLRRKGYLSPADVMRIGWGFAYGEETPLVKGTRWCSLNGFSLHANTSTNYLKRDRLYKLIEYIARGPIR
ncbi:MAG: transposase [Proteobacteria bacterium]|nr:transposase [Pseudomonadota bacterium]